MEPSRGSAPTGACTGSNNTTDPGITLPVLTVAQTETLRAELIAFQVLQGITSDVGRAGLEPATNGL